MLSLPFRLVRSQDCQRNFEVIPPAVNAAATTAAAAASAAAAAQATADGAAAGITARPQIAATITGTSPLPAEATPGAISRITMNASAAVDTNGWWDSTNRRYTPQRAGRYAVVGYFHGTAAGTTGWHDLSIVRSGATQTMTRTPASSSYGPEITVAAQVVMNGTTDYIELWGGASSGATVAGTEQLDIVYLGPA